MSTDLHVVEDEQAPAGLHIRVKYDIDSVIASLYNGEEHLGTGSGYVFVKNHDSWQDARNEAVELASEKAAIVEKYGPPPATEYIPLGDSA